MNAGVAGQGPRVRLGKTRTFSIDVFLKGEFLIGSRSNCMRLTAMNVEYFEICDRTKHVAGAKTECTLFLFERS